MSVSCLSHREKLLFISALHRCANWRKAAFLRHNISGFTLLNVNGRRVMACHYLGVTGNSDRQISSLNAHFMVCSNQLNSIGFELNSESKN